MTIQKVCSTCKTTKPITGFGIRTEGADGYRNQCKECQKENRVSRIIRYQNNPLETLEKVCGCCKVVKPTACFSEQKMTKTNLHSWCRSCIQQKRRKMICKRVTLYLQWYSKFGSKCVDCGEPDINVIEADHLDPSVKCSLICRGKTHGSEQQFAIELDKCVPRCVICHRLRSAKQFPKTNPKKRLRQKQFVNEAKKTIGCCSMCKRQVVTEDDLMYQAFDFDHLERSAKTTEVSKLVTIGASNERIAEEIAKCRLLCANCHRRYTREQMGYFIIVDEVPVFPNNACSQINS